ncbi:MAG: hypothetical protein ACJ76X_02625 [Solirubrobacteraceae bacterium]
MAVKVWTALMVSAVAMLCAPAAHADDLLLLNGDNVTLSGAHQYGFVYVDGDMRLSGDTSISATSIYIGPNAYVPTCYVPGSGDNACANGRSLTLRATGKLTMSSRIDLTGGTGSPRSAGNLSLSGNPVTVGGDINTSGENGGASGQINISSAGSIATGSLNTQGAPVNLGAIGSIDVGGDVNTYGSSSTYQPDPTRVQSGSPVTINSTAGDVRVDGNVNAGGRDAPAAGAMNGGNGGQVSIAGSNVRVGAIDSTGGGSAAGAGGASAPITVTGRSAVHVLGRLSSNGQNSSAAGTQATPGSRIAVTAGGQLIAAGGATVDGATGPFGGSAGGTISLTGNGTTAGDLSADGGNAPNVTPSVAAGAGGTISVSSSGGASLGSLSAQGGNAYNGGVPGHGGAVAASAGFGSLATADVQTHGGYSSSGPAADGGPIGLSALGDLTVSSSLNAAGSDSSSSGDPARGGGSAGSMLLRAASGTLSLDGGAFATGGRGQYNPTSGHRGGPGGRGGRIDVIAHALGPITTISSAGGDGGSYGLDQGPGGGGGPIFAWTDAPLFDSQKVVVSDGGDGNPVGPAGLQRQDSSPAALTLNPITGTLSFTPRSPDAQRYRLLASIAGAAPRAILQTSGSTGLKPKTAACVPVRFSVVAVNDPLGWTSDPSPAVTYMKRPSANQRCDQAPPLTTKQSGRRSLRKLRRAGWRTKIAFTARGIGALVARLHTKRSAAALWSWSTRIKRAGALDVPLRLPARARKRGSYVLTIVTTSPDGKRHARTNLTLEIVK